jgi:hypothetical protein
MLSFDELRTITLKLLTYCQANEWAGYDPYDALNSEIFRGLPFLDFKLFRLGFTQVMKRLPFNLRPLLFVPKTENPKAIALFLMAFLKLDRLGLLDNKELVPLMIQKLIDLRSPSTAMTCNPQLATNDLQPATCNLQPVTRNNYWSWGYSFPWQTRTVLVPRGAPNLVCTTFVANALLDAYEIGSDPKVSYASNDLPAGALAQAGSDLRPQTLDALCLEMAVSAAEYILNELYWTDGNSVACFSYPLPSSRGRVHNANFLGAALLCRIYKNCGEKKFLEPALKVARYSATKQKDDGSWDYGESSTQGWVDNFHTGYNLCALRSISKSAGTTEFESNIYRGFEFYRKHFFKDNGVPKYFHDSTFPIDIHSVAQSIITLLTLRDLDETSVETAFSMFHWATTHMCDQRGRFYYQVFPFFKNKISYMRWSQAWMLLALSTLLEHLPVT